MNRSTVVDVAISLATYPIVVVPVFLALSYGMWVSPIMLALAFMPWPIAYIRGVRLPSLIPDIVFGLTDTGLMMVFSILGAVFIGVVGAIVGAGVGDAITDSLGGIFEGAVASKLRDMGIEEARTPLGCSMGKLSGCLLGAGIVISISQLIGLAIVL